MNFFTLMNSCANNSINMKNTRYSSANFFEVDRLLHLTVYLHLPQHTPPACDGSLKKG